MSSDTVLLTERPRQDAISRRGHYIGNANTVNGGTP